MNINIEIPMAAIGRLDEMTLHQYVLSAEREILYTALKNAHDNKAMAAKALGMTYRSFRHKLPKLGIFKPSIFHGSNDRQSTPPRSGFTKRWPKLRIQALKLYGGRCHCCGATKRDTRIDVDHIKPKGRYPLLALDINNLQILCYTCHLAKGHNDETDWRKV